MKKKKIFAPTITFVTGILSIIPLFAQNIADIEIDTANFADTTIYFEKIVKDGIKKEVQNQTLSDVVYWWSFTEFITSITHNEPIFFNSIYNRVLKGTGRSYLKVFLDAVFASFEFIDDGTEQNILSEAINSQNADAFMEFYEKLSNTDKQKLLSQTFSHLEIKDDWEINFSKLIKQLRKKSQKNKY